MGRISFYFHSKAACGKAREALKTLKNPPGYLFRADNVSCAPEKDIFTKSHYPTVSLRNVSYLSRGGIIVEIEYVFETWVTWILDKAGQNCIGITAARNRK